MYTRGAFLALPNTHLHTFLWRSCWTWPCTHEYVKQYNTSIKATRNWRSKYRDGRAKKYTNKNRRDNKQTRCIPCTLFHFYILLSSNRISLKKCMGMHLVCLLSLLLLCTFWPCRPYLLLQFLVVYVIIYQGRQNQSGKTDHSFQRLVG